ncbi:MAG: DEAD/DEAH box helicase, partial [ANME-2 cluster archaeon]
MTSSYDYNEQNISQKPAMEVLHNLGYDIIAPKDAEALRGNLYNVLLTPILKKQLEKINSFEYKSETLKFSNKNIEQAIRDLDESLTNGLVKTNEKIYDTLMLGRSYQETLSDGTIRSFT